MRRATFSGFAVGFLIVATSLGVAAFRPPAGPRLVAVQKRATKTLVFDDEFNGSSLDRSKWNDSWYGTDPNPSGPINGAEDDCYDPRQVTVGGGQLTLTATKRSCLGYQWASGLVNTNGKFSFTKGVVKVGVWIPASGSACADWGGIWSDGRNWPYDGEIDGWECLGGNGAWHVHSTQPTVGGGHLGPGHHVIKWVRTASTVTIYYDKIKQGSASTSSFSTSPHYLVLNLAVSSSISPPEMAAQIHFDYVRVWS